MTVVRTWLAALSVAVVALGGWGAVQGAVVARQARVLAAAQHQASAGRRELAHAQAVIHAEDARITGQHRDLITCGDLQNMGLQSYWQDSNYNLQSDPVPLPVHCINP